MYLIIILLENFLQNNLYGNWECVGELFIWDKDASILASGWSSGDHCSTLVGTGSKHK